jgi:hypothetical protein
MENVTENLEKSMKNSSASSAPASAAAANGSEHPVPAAAPGLTVHDRQIVHGGSGAHDDEATGFTLVTRSKRGRASTAQKAAPGAPFLPPPPESRDSDIGTEQGAEDPELTESTGNFVDPFGLSKVSPLVNLVTYARTKQSVRQHSV